MSTLTAWITRAGRVGQLGLAGRRTWGAAAPLLVTGALAAGCGSVRGGGVAVGTAGRAAATSGAVHASAPATRLASGSPVPTVSGGPAPAGGAACAGWPSGATSAALPASFVPVSVDQCVHRTQAVPGKGRWTTATLERSTGDLSGLVSALRQPSATRKPGTVCPAIAMIPPQVVLINAAGEKLIPRLPLGGCGFTAPAVLAALSKLSWQPVSVRLIAKVPGTAPAPPASGATPRSGGAVHPG